MKYHLLLVLQVQQVPQDPPGGPHPLRLARQPRHHVGVHLNLQQGESKMHLRDEWFKDFALVLVLTFPIVLATFFM